MTAEARGVTGLMEGGLGVEEAAPPFAAAAWHPARGRPTTARGRGACRGSPGFSSDLFCLFSAAFSGAPNSVSHTLFYFSSPHRTASGACARCLRPCGQLIVGRRANLAPRRPGD